MAENPKYTKEFFAKFEELQKIMIRKFDLEAEIANLPRDLKDRQDHVGRLDDAYQKELADSQAAQAELEDLKARYQAAGQAREDAEKKAETTTTQREFELVEKEIKDADENEHSLLDQVRAKESELQQYAADLAQKEQELKDEQASVQAEQEKIDQDTASKKAEMEKLEAECESYVQGDITRDLYEKFSTIVRAKHAKDGDAGKGIVPIHGVVCQGCHIVLPVEFVNEVRSGRELQFCPYCSRILYYEETENGEKDFTDAQVQTSADEKEEGEREKESDAMNLISDDEREGLLD